MTWILVLTIQWAVGSWYDSTRAVALDHIAGFKSLAECQRAAETLKATNSLLSAVCLEQSK